MASPKQIRRRTRRKVRDQIADQIVEAQLAAFDATGDAAEASDLALTTLGLRLDYGALDQRANAGAGTSDITAPGAGGSNDLETTPQDDGVPDGVSVPGGDAGSPFSGPGEPGSTARAGGSPDLVMLALGAAVLVGLFYFGRN